MTSRVWEPPAALRSRDLNLRPIERSAKRRLRKNAEIEAKNKKIEETNTIVERTFNAGNAALGLKNYDEAITQYDAGLAADAEQPMILANKSVALKARGVAKI